MLDAAGLISDSASLAATREDSWETDEIIGDEPGNDYTTRDFELTDLGRRYYQALIGELPEGTEREVSDFKARFAGLPLRQLIRYVYTRYDEYTDKSLIRDDVLRG
jgi:hypothetical protein